MDSAKYLKKIPECNVSNLKTQTIKTYLLAKEVHDG